MRLDLHWVDRMEFRRVLLFWRYARLVCSCGQKSRWRPFYPRTANGWVEKWNEESERWLQQHPAGHK